MMWERVEGKVAKVRPMKGLVCLDTREFSIQISLIRVTKRGIEALL